MFKKIALVVGCTAALLFGVTFTIKNAQIVQLSYYFGIDWQGPLSWLLIIVLLVGVFLGMLVCFVTTLKKKIFSGRVKNKKQIEST